MKITAFNCKTGKYINGTTKRFGKRAVTLRCDEDNEYRFELKFGVWRCENLPYRSYEIVEDGTEEYKEAKERAVKNKTEYEIEMARNNIEILSQKNLTLKEEYDRLVIQMKELDRRIEENRKRIRKWAGIE